MPAPPILAIAEGLQYSPRSSGSIPIGTYQSHAESVFSAPYSFRTDHTTSLGHTSTKSLGQHSAKNTIGSATASTSSHSRKTVGGYVIITSPSCDDSDLDSASSNESAQRMFEELCTNALIDNEMAMVMNDQKKVLLRGLSHNKFLTQRSMSFDSGDEGVKPAPVNRIGSQDVSCLPDETATALRSLFSPGAAKHMKPHHSALNRVVRHIFALDELSIRVREHTSTKSTQSDINALWNHVTEKITASRLGRFISGDLEKFVKTSWFVWFFMFLSVYILFGPDLITMLTNRSVDDAFIILHTIIFFLFIIEFCLLMLAVKSYAFSLASALDLVAIFSVLSDTWFLYYSDLGENKLVGAARIARTTRVARVTKLVPRIMATLRARRSISLARNLMLRRLWRAFQYLDTDRDGLISSFDLKCLYLAIVNDCPTMLQQEKGHLVTLDVPDLLESAPDGDVTAEHWNALNWEQFSKLFMQTSLAADVLEYHLSDVKHDAGVWLLTARVSDNSALKVCTGILILIIVMNLLDAQDSDLSSTQGLFHLYSSLLYQKAQGTFSTASICNLVEEYKSELKVLFLYMDGITWVNYGSSSCPTTFNGDQFDRIDDILDLAKLRTVEVIRSCLPRSEDSTCSRDANVAVALINIESEYKEILGFSLLSTFIVTLIITVLIVAFSQGISNFLRTTLQPLRALADDMIAIASVDLVMLDAEMPNTKPDRMVDELQHLQNSFKAMRGAIRSWSRYVPPSVVQKLFNAGKEATIGVVRTQVSILFVDVENFEISCSGMEPEEVINLLASYLEKIALVIGNNRGTLLEFIGDEVLAVFNTPNATRRHVLSAVTSSIQVHEHVATLPPYTTKDGRNIIIRCRCGVHTAHVLAGNVGSNSRMKYGLLGDGVNLTARLKGLNSRYNTQTIASEKVFQDDLCCRRAAFRPLDRVAVKGKTEPTTVYEILGFSKGAENSAVYKEVARTHSEAFRLFYDRQFVEAKALFTSIAKEMESLSARCRLSASELDQPSRQLRLRCAQNIKHEPGPTWDGVEVLTKKTFQITSDDGEETDIEANELYDLFSVPLESGHRLDASMGPTYSRRVFDRSYSPFQVWEPKNGQADSEASSSTYVDTNPGFCSCSTPRRGIGGH